MSDWWVLDLNISVLCISMMLPWVGEAIANQGNGNVHEKEDKFIEGGLKRVTTRRAVFMGLTWQRISINNR